VLVTGGYEQHPEWLGGGGGYAGTLVALAGSWAAVELDEELVIERAAGHEGGWPDFGTGSESQAGLLLTARGRWLALSQAWRGWAWKEPIGRLHVGLCPERPDIDSVPRGGGIGAWVETHATMEHLVDSAGMSD
jgi:hypothetical protein